MTRPFVKTDYPVPQLELPDWLPGPVTEEAQLVYNNILKHDWKCYPRPLTASEEIKVLLRLASDQRMKKVWNELLKKKRNRPCEFLHPFVPTDLADGNPQDLALRFFFRAAWDLATCGIELKTLNQLKPFTKLASRLQRDAQSLRSLGLDEFASDLEAKAIVCERMGRFLPNSSFISVVKRARGDQTMRAFILRLSRYCREWWFGKVLTATIATTASVALSKKISAKQVRNLVRSATPGLIAEGLSPLASPSWWVGRPKIDYP
jgi:hypothetical protein